MQIEKNIPTNTDMTPSGGARLKYPFKKMEVGDSFLAEGKNTSACRAYVAAKAYGTRHNLMFIGQADGAGSVRIWRTA